jgi:DNA helicase-2/ATP-dependent DNA helicase PcrA
LGFERVLIVPYGGITKWLNTGNSDHVADSADEVYVGITRAYQSIHDGNVAVPGISIFQPE